MKDNRQPEDEPRIYITEATKLFNRSDRTLRSWDRPTSKLPKELWPYRDENDHRFWTKSLVERTITWMEENDFYPGSGLKWDPPPDVRREHLENLRKATQRRGSNGHSDQLDAFETIVRDAVLVRKIPIDQMLSKMYGVIQQFDIPLAEGLRILADVVDERE